MSDENNCCFCGLLTNQTYGEIPVCSSCEIEHIGDDNLEFEHDPLAWGKDGL